MSITTHYTQYIHTCTFVYTRPLYLLLYQLHTGASVHEELVMVAPLSDGGSMSVNDILNLHTGELIQNGSDI